MNVVLVDDIALYARSRKCDVLNRGLSGYNTRWAKIVLPRLIGKDSKTENTVAVTIFFGANDSALKGIVDFYSFLPPPLLSFKMFLLAHSR